MTEEGKTLDNAIQKRVSSFCSLSFHSFASAMAIVRTYKGRSPIQPMWLGPTIPGNPDSLSRSVLMDGSRLSNRPCWLYRRPTLIRANTHHFRSKGMKRSRTKAGKIHSLMLGNKFAKLERVTTSRCPYRAFGRH
jgi:hypothetical protein